MRGSLGVPLHRLLPALLYADGCLVAIAQITLAPGIAQIGGLAVKLLRSLAGFIAPAQVTKGGGIVLLGSQPI